ncbi:GGDEF domain-containing protein [Pseudomonas berkeleyensis]|uniref:diguanylate cyclase n=1 Tax=Pseudomonas berkeleyensis TaxID=2726956 RepID=A0A7G5DK19_9PSED|nr:GGDEF domain-containing protein [Pseudomonas berkeleyensis]QMV62094.1 GGDEF domain-containing protein [Pseudomonas berkeleyensis]WSO37535.1 GGDEF domain-containing protein [Pseudomonas berkeleyensis]
MSASESGIASSRQSAWVIPAALQTAYQHYVVQHHGRFLLAINFIAMIAYDLYVFADALLIPDMALESLLLRGGMSLVGLVNIYLVFWRYRNVLLMDMLMPVHDIISTIAWFELLKRSSSPDVPTFVYASVVFIILANLGARYSFRGILACSAAISGIILYNQWLLHDGQSKPVLVFSIAYLPVLLFSLFISWTNINGVRRAFLDDQEKQRQRDELAALNLRLARQASTDALTDIGNRRAFDLALEENWQQMQRNGRPFSLLLLDIDFFKPFNDHYGHQVGDQCLCEVARCISAGLRQGQGNVYRYGGEEFVVLLQITDVGELNALAERLREQVANLAIEHQYRPDGLNRLTISIGACTTQAAGVQQARDLFAQCDRLLYQAKQQGRNQVCSQLLHALRA